MTRSKRAAEKPRPKCDNHRDRDAVLTTDGSKFQVMHLCRECIPAHWK